MRAVTEPYSPPECDEPSASRNTERRPLETCAIDRRALDAVMAEVAQLTSATACEADIRPAPPSAGGSPAWMQLLRLEELVCAWMSANDDCDRAALAELAQRSARPPSCKPGPMSAPAPAAAPSANSDYVAKMAAQLVRRSA